MKRLFSAILLSGIALSAYATLPFAPYQARYTVVWRGMEVGESIHRFEHIDETHYRLASDTEPYLGFLPYDYSESAEFRYENGQIVPETYHFNNREGIHKEKGVLTFDWISKRVHNDNEKAPWESTLKPGVFDKLTQTLAMRKDLMENRETFVYDIVEEGKRRTYTFTLLGEEPLETAIGTLSTLKLEHKHPRRKRRTVFWVSPEHDYLLVKMAQYRKGKLVAGGQILEYEPQPAT